MQMRTSPFWTSSSAALVALLAVFSVSAPTPASIPVPPETSDLVNFDLPPDTRKMAEVEIDGRIITAELVITRIVGGTPQAGSRPTTTVGVQLSVNDGAALPAGLEAVGVRFEKLAGLKRFFFTPLASLDVQPSDDGLFEEDTRNFIGDLSDRTIVKRLRATLRLEYQGEVIRVPFGVARIATLQMP